MRIVVVFIAAVAGCGANGTGPTNPAWEGYDDLSAPLAAGGAKANIGGIGEAVDIVNPRPDVATAVYMESSQRVGNDAPGSYYMTTRWLEVISGSAGTTTLSLRRAGTRTEIATATITVADPASLMLPGYRALIIDDSFWPHATRLDSNGSPLLGTGGVQCSASSAVSGVVTAPADCSSVLGNAPGDAVLTATTTTGNLTATMPLTVIQGSDVRGIDFTLLSTGAIDSTKVVTMRLTAESDLGPVLGGWFNCTLDGQTDDCMQVDTTPSDAAGRTLTFYGCAAGTHTLSCALGPSDVATTATTVQLP